MKVWPGNPYPLGATWDRSGVNFALFSENATGVELCLFDSENRARETKRIQLTKRPTRYGTFICRKCGQDSSTAIVCMDLTAPPKATGLTQPNFFWIPSPILAGPI